MDISHLYRAIVFVYDDIFFYPSFKCKCLDAQISITCFYPISFKFLLQRTRWKLANVKINRGKKGRPVPRREREKVHEIPIDDLISVCLYLDY